MKKEKEKWVEIDLRQYPGFRDKFTELCKLNINRSKRYYRKVLKDNFDLDVRFKILDGIKTIHLSEADAIVFKLKYS